MFYRPGGSATRIGVQIDEVYTDTVDGATGWLQVVTGNVIGINIARATIQYVNAASSIVSRNLQSPEAVVVLEMKTLGDGDPWPIDTWQNLIVATSRKANRNGWVRLRIVNINDMNGDGVSMAMQISRNTTMET